MIDPKNHTYHVEILGSEEKFNEMIEAIRAKAVWLSDEEIEEILDEETEKNIGPSFWYSQMYW